MAEEGVNVILNVYDLSQGLARQLSTTFLAKAIEGIWHTGIVVYGKEYYFGGGIQSSPEGQTPYGKPWKVVELGVTHIPEEVLEDFLHEISPRYTAETYSLLRHNCNNFSNEVAQFLVGCSIPDFILRLPEEVMNSPMGALIMPMITQFESVLRNGGVPQVPHSRAFPSILTTGAQQQQQAPSVPVKAEVKLDPTASVMSKEEILIPPPVVKPAEAQASKKTVENGPSESESKKPCSSATDPLGSARTKVQEEITREFANLMANGTLRASEAAALATRRVMEKHGSLRTTTSSQG